MNSSQLSISRSLDEFFTPTPMTYLSFSLSFDTSGEKSESPDAITNRSMCSLEYDMSIASTAMRMSAEFFPEYDRPGISISSIAASCRSGFRLGGLSQRQLGAL